MLIDQSFIGAPVYDRDGHQIGTVKEISGSAFKVDVPLQLDYWLHIDSVDSADVGRIVLTVDQDHLHEQKVDGPDDAIPHEREPFREIVGSSADGIGYDTDIRDRELLHHDPMRSPDMMNPGVDDVGLGTEDTPPRRTDKHRAA